MVRIRARVRVAPLAQELLHPAAQVARVEVAEVGQAQAVPVRDSVSVLAAEQVPVVRAPARAAAPGLVPAELEPGVGPVALA
jgi:hypothetical protein